MTTQDALFDGPEDLGKFRTGLWIAGAASILLGALAIVFPFVAAMAAALVFGVVLATLGGVEIIRALFSPGSDQRLWVLVFGLLSLAAGAVLLLYPFEGVLTLTVLLATFFVLGGIVKLLGAWQLSPPRRRAGGLPELRGWGRLAFSGVVSLLLGSVLFLGLPVSAIWALGLLIGMDLIFLGVSEIAIAMALSSSSGGRRGA